MQEAFSRFIGRLTWALIVLQAALMSFASYHHGITHEPVVILMTGNGPQICSWAAIVLFFVLVLFGLANASRRLLAALGTGWLVLYLGFKQYLWHPQNHLTFAIIAIVAAYAALILTFMVHIAWTEEDEGDEVRYRFSLNFGSAPA